MIITQVIMCKLGNFERQIYRCYRKRSSRGFCAGLKHSRKMFGVVLGPFNKNIRYV